MPEITLLALTVSLLPILGVAWISHRWAGSGGEMFYSTGRMLVQLLLVGFVLVFVFASPSPWIGAIVVSVMILASSAIAVRTVSTDRMAAFWKAVISIGLVGSLVLIFILYVVLRLSGPLYQPRMMIPLAGMIFSNAMTAITLAAERLQREEEAGLSFPQARSAAWTAALIPQINALFSVGIVSLPGMMTGQILSGVDPLIAVRYQIVVMAMILQASGYGVALFLWLSHRPKNMPD